MVKLLVGILSCVVFAVLTELVQFDKAIRHIVEWHIRVFRQHIHSFPSFVRHGSKGLETLQALSLFFSCLELDKDLLLTLLFDVLILQSVKQSSFVGCQFSDLSHGSNIANLG